MWRVHFKFALQPKLVITGVTASILIAFLYAQFLPWYGMIGIPTAVIAVVWLAHRHFAMSDQELRERKAFHEAGHTIIAWLDPELPEVGKVTIVGEESEMKFVKQPANQEIIASQALGKAYLKMLMGGIAAEMEIFHAPSYGGENDYRYARWVSLQMRMLGTSSRFDEFERSFDRARSVISEKRNAMILLASALLEHGSLTTEDLSRMLGPRPEAAAERVPEAFATT